MRAYIDYLGGIGIGRYELDADELSEIGKFTRENIVEWFNSHSGPTWVGILPLHDFYAVCGDIHIPWATTDVTCPQCGVIYDPEAVRIGRHFLCTQCGERVSFRAR